MRKHKTGATPRSKLVGANTLFSQTSEHVMSMGRAVVRLFAQKGIVHCQRRKARSPILEARLSSPQGKRHEGELYFPPNKVGSNSGSSSR